MEFYLRYNRGVASGQARIYRGPPAAGGKPDQLEQQQAQGGDNGKTPHS